MEIVTFTGRIQCKRERMQLTYRACANSRNRNDRDSKKLNVANLYKTQEAVEGHHHLRSEEPRHIEKNTVCIIS